jgi:FkbM family methyltransferase
LQIPNFIKKIAKKLQAALPFAIGKNEGYDRYTKKIIIRICAPDSICIDIGANEGKILEWITQAAPLAHHYAFEPIPRLYQILKFKYSDHATVMPIAISDQKSISNFNLVTTNTALSGLKKRPYASFHQEETIEVATDLLDNIIPEEQKVVLIKIDVEGGEWNVLKGASRTIHHSKPIILFECGKIGGTLYGYGATDIFQLFEMNFNYQIYTLKGWLNTNTELSYKEFEKFYENGDEYFFLAAPKSIHKNS